MSDVPEQDLTHIEVLSHLRTTEKRAEVQRTAWRAGLGAPTVLAAAPTLLLSRRSTVAPESSAHAIAPWAPPALSPRLPPNAQAAIEPTPDSPADRDDLPPENYRSVLLFLALVALSFAAVLVLGMAAVASLGLLPPLAAALFGLGGLLIAFGMVTLSATLLLPVWAQRKRRRG
ncbi:hypothetical protein LBMAG42_52350 [Deltaproteobacteria bacterium]|nr:hypothetical protein LBMAG42_52350 [Deltaproteobacteria bacterium]